MTDRASRAAHHTNRDGASSLSQDSDEITITPTEIHADAAGGGALNLTSAFTFPTTNGNTGYTMLITLGGTGVATIYTLTGTVNGVLGVVDTVTFAGAGGGTEESVLAFTALTSITTNVDPVAVSEFDTLDSVFTKHVRRVWVGGAGNLSCLLVDDSTDARYRGIAASTMLGLEVKRIRADLAARSGITETTATLITVAR